MLWDKPQDCKPLSNEAYYSHNHGCKYCHMGAVVGVHNDRLSDVPDMDQQVFHDLCGGHHLAQDGALHDGMVYDDNPQDGIVHDVLHDVEEVHNDLQDDGVHDVLHEVEEVHNDQQGGEIHDGHDALHDGHDALHDGHDALHDVQQEHVLDGLLLVVVGHTDHLVVDDGDDVEL